jgi:hypothetical protein
LQYDFDLCKIKKRLMLTRISWTDYLVTIVILLLIYYAFVLSLFYKQDILLLITGKDRRILTATDEGLQNDNFSEVIEPLADEVKALIGQSSYGNMPVEESKKALNRLMASERFQCLKETSYYEQLNQLIAREYETYCSMHLSEEDLEGLWRGM